MKKALHLIMQPITAATIIVTCISLASCNESLVYEVNNSLKGEVWSYADAQTFETEIKDTTINYDVFVNLRHSFHFDWRNVWINIETTFPDGKKASKRVNLLLSEADGKWFGECTGDNCDIQIPIQENAFFPQIGKYKFSITQDMRVNPLINIRSIGMKIERHNKTAN
jgi:gliding motility-associated lipoprotein GldH